MLGTDRYEDDFVSGNGHSDSHVAPGSSRAKVRINTPYDDDASSRPLTSVDLGLHQPRVPLANGALTGKFSSSMGFAASSVPARDPTPGADLSRRYASSLSLSASAAVPRREPPTTPAPNPTPAATITLVNPQRTLIKELRTIVNNAEFHDVVFVVEDNRPVYAHRAILGARSPKFQQLFLNSKEVTIAKPIPEIPLPHVSYEAFVGMMYYIYSDTTEVSLEATMDILGLATVYSLDLLKALCERALELNLAIENGAWMFAGADRHKSARLREVALAFAVKNFDTVSKTRGFEELSHVLILEILKRR
eukprot:TRINITY_DN26980_c0_g1_i1.p1 TRINITY_DN26980_c0_g1~~TRINITY_DN26980_c0_g1_i1.p1  ORF type:complete len:307 (-),score=93.36 TRINITY_DN26980_c0_g1_i1:506-1426(-)